MDNRQQPPKNALASLEMSAKNMRPTANDD